MCRTKRCVICAANRAAISSLAPRSGERVASAEGASRVRGILCADLSGRRRRLSRVAILEFGRLEERGGRSRGDPCEVAGQNALSLTRGCPSPGPRCARATLSPLPRGEGVHRVRGLVTPQAQTNTLYAEERDPRVAAGSSARNGSMALMVASGNSSCTASLPWGSRTVRMPPTAASASISARDLGGVSAP